jgi:uncharacterized protein YukE
MESIKVPEANQFNQQAQLHYQVRDGLNQLISDFTHHHDTILSQLDSSQVEHYSTWWQNLKTYLSNQAYLHDQLGKNLITAGENYQTVDQNIAKSMQE